MIEGGDQRTKLENYYSRRRVWPTSETVSNVSLDEHFLEKLSPEKM